MSATSIDDDAAVRLAVDGLNNVQIADRLGCDESSVRRALRRKGFSRHLLPVEQQPGRFAFELDTPMEIHGDVMVTADWHVPLYSPRYVNQMIETARSNGIRQLLIAGDFFNFDALSSYDPKQDEANLEREYYEGLAVMRVLLETFDRIFYLWGNHDARMHRALGFKLRFVSAMEMVFGRLGEEALSRMTFSNLDHAWIWSDYHSYPWYVCHPANYSRVPLSNPQKLAAKYNANVICAHSHHAAVGYATDGEKIVVEGGGLFDVSKTAYLQRSTTFPTWQQGYSWFKDGRYFFTSPAWEIR